MLLADAQTGAGLAQSIVVATAEIAALNSAITNGAVLAAGNILMVGPVINSVPFVVGGLSVAESSTIFGAMLSVLNGRLTAWNATLAAL